MNKERGVRSPHPPDLLLRWARLDAGGYVIGPRHAASGDGRGATRFCRAVHSPQRVQRRKFVVHETMECNASDASGLQSCAPALLVACSSDTKKATREAKAQLNVATLKGATLPNGGEEPSVSVPVGATLIGVRTCCGGRSVLAASSCLRRCWQAPGQCRRQKRRAWAIHERLGNGHGWR